MHKYTENQSVEERDAFDEMLKKTAEHVEGEPEKNWNEIEKAEEEKNKNNEEKN